MSEHPSFDDVMARLKAGDDRGAGEVWNRYVKRLKGLARKKLDGRLQGKVSDSTIALSALASFFKGNKEQGRFEFHSWDDIWSLLAMIALRKCDNAFARVFGTQMRDPTREERPAPFLDGSEESRASWEAIARDPTPEQAAALHETLQELIAGLDQQERQILQLTGEGYNTVRLHSALGYITPQDKLQGKEQEIFAARDRKLAEARERRRCLRQARHASQQNAATSNPSRRPIDFVALRALIPIALVLQLLGFQPRTTRGAQQRGACPLHGSTSGTSRAFSVNLEEHVFQCFKCGRSGNAFDLWVAASKQSPYDAAQDLCQRLHLPVPYLPLPANRNREEEPVSPPSSNTCTMPAASNPALSLTH